MSHHANDRARNFDIDFWTFWTARFANMKTAMRATDCNRSIIFWWPEIPGMSTGVRVVGALDLANHHATIAGLRARSLARLDASAKRLTTLARSVAG